MGKICFFLPNAGYPAVLSGMPYLICWIIQLFLSGYRISGAAQPWFLCMFLHIHALLCFHVYRLKNINIVFMSFFKIHRLHKMIFIQNVFERLMKFLNIHTYIFAIDFKKNLRRYLYWYLYVVILIYFLFVYVSMICYSIFMVHK